MLFTNDYIKNMFKSINKVYINLPIKIVIINFKMLKLFAPSIGYSVYSYLQQFV
jgi:hypothetical protein